MNNSNRQIRVLSYNIHKGFYALGKRLILEEIRELIRRADVDLVFLQEVLGEHHLHAKSIYNWPSTSQYEFLADQIWQDHCYGKNAIYEEGHHGNAILSRYPIVGWENIDLSTNRFEQRGLLYSVIETDFGLIHVCSTHLNLTNNGRMKQVDRMSQFLLKRVAQDSPLILAGDFNDWRKRISGPLLEALNLREVIESSYGRLLPTFPAIFPLFSIDRIYIRGFGIVDAQILSDSIWRNLSDHLPVRAVLDLTI